MLDLCIRGGIVVDGSGGPSFRGDVGIEAGRIVEIGDVRDRARRELDADGLIVSPGFIDVHTHYDAQLMWDPAATPSSLNGVTTVFGGNCGFTIAPLGADSADYIVPMLARVEGMPLAALEHALDLQWSTFGSWLDRLEGNLAVNAGFLAGHSAIRRAVMGEAAVERIATDDELAEIVALLERCIREGALGFSTTRAPTHVDHMGRLVPSHAADVREIIELCAAAGRHEGTTLEIVPSIEPRFSEADTDLLTRMSATANRPINWNLLRVRPGEEEGIANRLAAADHAAAHGGRIVALLLPQPFNQRLTMESGYIYETLPGWAPVMALPIEQRLTALVDPEVRARLAGGAEQAPPRLWRQWADQLVCDVGAPELARFVGRRIGDIAAERAQDPFDALLDLLVADRLRTGLLPPAIDAGDACWAERVRLADDHRIVLGGSDAGAHVDMMKTFGCYANFLGEAVRKRGLTSWERAVHWISDVPAQLYGVRGRGRLAPGAYADINVLDPATIDAGPVEMRRDLPGGNARLYGEAVGILHTFVNGVEIARSGTLTGDQPGAVIRSGRDTATVTARAVGSAA